MTKLLLFFNQGRSVFINILRFIFILYFTLFLNVSVLPVYAQIDRSDDVASTNLILSSDISFSCDWGSGIIGDGCWQGIQAVASDRLQRVNDPTQCCSYAVRVEVRPGDDPIKSSGERAEFVNMSDTNGNPIYENVSSGVKFYAFSVLLDPSWPVSITNRYAIIFQLHGPDNLGASPAFAIEATDKFSVDMSTGNLDVQSANKNYQLSKNSLNLGHWVNFIVMIKYAADETGAVGMWRRDEGATGFTQVLSVNNIATLQYRASPGSVGNHYWKYGLYRTANPTVTDILWIGPMTRGSTFNSVLTPAFNLILPNKAYLPAIRR